MTNVAIKEKAEYFATVVGNNESYLKTNSTSWLEEWHWSRKINTGLKQFANGRSYLAVSFAPQQQ